MYQTHDFDAELTGINDDILNVNPLIEDEDELYYTYEEVIDGINVVEFTPYLRSMSSMTKKEQDRYDILVEETVYRPGILNCSDLINFCHEHHLDYLGLIEKGLALKAPEGMY